MTYAAPASRASRARVSSISLRTPLRSSEAREQIRTTVPWRAGRASGGRLLPSKVEFSQWAKSELLGLEENLFRIHEVNGSMQGPERHSRRAGEPQSAKRHQEALEPRRLSAERT